MDLYLKRYFWLLGVIVVVVCATFAARAVASVVEARYLSEGNGPAVHRPTPTPSPAETPEADKPKSKAGAPIADRNMFCSACLPEVAAPVVDAGPSDPNNPPATGLPLRLLATNVSTVEAHSFATIINTANEHGGAYWIGHTIPNVGKVTRIRGKFVDFENTSARRIERLNLGGEAAPPPAVAEAPAEEPSGEPKDDLTAAFDAGIKRVDDSNFEIDRALVDRVLQNPMAVAKGARVVPSVKNGKPNGFKLYAIRPSSVYSKLGLMNGDTLNSINGFDLTTPDKALEVYTKVRESSNLSITVTRRGKPVTMNYSIK